MSADISFRKAEYDRPSDAAAIGSLYLRVFKTDMADTLDFWYGANPAGEPYGIVACDGDRIIGHFGTMAVMASVRGRQMAGRVSMGFMVDADYRGRGVAGGLSPALFAGLREAGESKFVIGFPNDVSYRMHVERMGYESIRDFSFVEFPKTLPAPGGSAGYAGYNKVARIEQGVMPQSETNSLVHSADYLNWRYAAPVYDIFLSERGQYFVSTRFRDKADVLYWPYGVSREEVLAFASFLYENYGVGRVCAWNTYDWLNGFPADARRYHMTIHILSDNADEQKALRGEWLFYMGDCELF